MFVKEVIADRVGPSMIIRQFQLNPKFLQSFGECSVTFRVGLLNTSSNTLCSDISLGSACCTSSLFCKNAWSVLLDTE